MERVGGEAPAVVARLVAHLHPYEAGSLPALSHPDAEGDPHLALVDAEPLPREGEPDELPLGVRDRVQGGKSYLVGVYG